MNFFDLFRRKNATVLTSAALEALVARGSSTFSGVNVTPAKAMTYAPFFACVRVLAETVGQIPIHVFETKGRQKTEATDHPVHRLLHTDGPNNFQTPQEFIEWVVTCLAMRGNAYSFITQVRGEIRELLPISPGAVKPRMLDDGGTVVYDVTLKSGTTTFPSSAIYHVRLFTLDGVNGLSPIGFARETIGSGLAAQEHGARLFANAAHPGGLLSTDKQLSLDASKRLISNVELLVGGLDNAGRTLVLGDGMKYQQIGMNSADAEWLEGRKFTRSEIAGIMRVPAHLIADLDRATFSNIEHMSQSFIDYSLTPYFTRIEARARKQLFSPDERKTHAVKFNANALLRGDMQARANFYTAMVQNGAMSPNEIRELEDRNPREGGDVYLTPANMVINGKVAPPADLAKPPA